MSEPQGMGQQPDEAAVEELDGEQVGTETPEAPPEAPGAAEPVEADPPVFVFTRADALLVMGLLVSGRGREPANTWSEAEWQAEKRLYAYMQGRIDAECTPEPALCNYGHTMADHEAAGACVRLPRPHWLPKQAWLGIKVGEWPLTAFTNRESAERWASVAGIGERERRIWPVDIPADTPVFKAETVPASTRLVEVQG